MNKISLLLNKQILLALGMIVFIGAVLAAGTGAFFSSSATATANVFTAGTLALRIAQDNAGVAVNGWLASQNAQWNFAAMTPGGTPSEDAVWLKNEGSVDGMTLGVALANAVETVPGLENQMRITEMTLAGVSLLSGGAGYGTVDFVAPTNCDIEVNYGDNDYSRISTAVDAATAGQVICVGSGNYSNAWETSGGGTGFPIRIDDNNVKVVAVEGPSVTNVGGGFIIDNLGVILSGFTINGQSTLLGETFGVYVNGAAIGAEISHNEIIGLNTPASRGVVAATGLSAVEVLSNNVTDWATGIYFNPSSNMVASYNTLEDNVVGISNDNPMGNTVTFNDIINNTLEGMGVLVNFGQSITITNNNIFGNGTDLVEYGSETVVAINNWWGSMTANTSGMVTSAPVAGGPIAGFINGVDGANANGFADMQDLRLNPIVNAGVSLNAGQEKQFVMAVQLDGPTTSNVFQGASLTTDVVFTLNQI